MGGWVVLDAESDNKIRRVEIFDTQISGFDIGIGVNIATLELKVEGNNIQGLTYDVQTNYNAYTGTNFPTVDFGGGPLGSKGKNTFNAAPKFAYYHNTGPYDVWACYNDWEVANNLIDPQRIYDQLDIPALGRVKWECLGGPMGTSQNEVLIAIPLENSNCRLGNSASLFDSADVLFADKGYTPVGRGPDNLWVAFTGPVYGKQCWVYSESLKFLLNGERVNLADLPTTLLPVISYPQRPIATSTRTQPPTRETAVPECSDGKDNDGDGRIDLIDDQCSSPSDNSESN